MTYSNVNKVFEMYRNFNQLLASKEDLAQRYSYDNGDVARSIYGYKRQKSTGASPQNINNKISRLELSEPIKSKIRSLHKQMKLKDALRSKTKLKLEVSKINSDIQKPRNFNIIEEDEMLEDSRKIEKVPQTQRKSNRKIKVCQN